MTNILLYCPMSNRCSRTEREKVFSQIKIPFDVKLDVFLDSSIQNIVSKYNKLADYIKDKDYDYILIIEEDIYPPDDILLNLYNNCCTRINQINYDIVSGFYKFRDSNTYMITRNNAYIDPYRYEKSIIEVDFIPFGCLFLSKKALLDIFPLIDNGIDATFCYIAKQKGYKLYAHTGIVCGHYKKPVVDIDVRDIKYITGITPNLNITGGIRRHFEIVKQFDLMGYNTQIITMDNKIENLDYFDYYNVITANEFLDIHYDIVFCVNSACFELFDKIHSKVKIIFVVSYSPEVYVEAYNKYQDKALFIGVGSNWKKQFNFKVRGYTIPGGINTDFFIPPVRRRDHSKFTIGFYRRMDNPNLRGINIIIETAKQLYNMSSEVKNNWQWIGFDTEDIDDSFWSQYEKYNIIPVKINNQDELLKTYWKCNAVIYPIEYGMWNNILAEGMSCKCLAIGTQFSSIDFLIDNITGIVVDRDIEYVVSKFKNILDNKIDIDKITENGYGYIQQFNWKNFVLRLLGILSRIKN